LKTAGPIWIKICNLDIIIYHFINRYLNFKMLNDKKKSLNKVHTRRIIPNTRQKTCSFESFVGTPGRLIQIRDE